MKLNSNSPLAVELRDEETRQHTVASQIRIGVPFQIRAMREHRGWTQAALAEKLGTTQNTISRLENPKTGKPTIKTLVRLAQAFDVGLLVRFLPFGFYGGVIESMDSTHVEIPSYDEELKAEVVAEAPTFNLSIPNECFLRVSNVVYGESGRQQWIDPADLMGSASTTIGMLGLDWSNPEISSSRFSLAQGGLIEIQTEMRKRKPRKPKSKKTERHAAWRPNQ